MQHQDQDENPVQIEDLGDRNTPGATPVQDVEEQALAKEEVDKSQLEEEGRVEDKRSGMVGVDGWNGRGWMG